MKKKIAMILALVIVASMALVGCGKGGNDKDALVGVWSGYIDITDTVNDEFMAGLGEDAEGLEGYKDLKLQVTLDLKADQTYTLTVEKDSVEQFMEQVKSQTKGILMAYMEKMLKDMGADMTPEEALEAAGISVDELIEQTFGSSGMDIEDMAVNVGGNYLAKDGEIHLADGKDKPEDVVPNPYTLKGDTLTIEADKLSATQDFAEFLFPMVLERSK